jgi:Holliday junction resolvasome RuvABC endonuclease subunit
MEERPIRTIMGIDPGASGGFATRVANGDVVVDRMPETCKDILDLIEERTWVDSEVSHLFCYIENVGGYRPGNSAPSAVKFARHCGHLEMALIASEVPHQYVAPSPWMRTVLGTVPSDKKERKTAIKKEMQRLYPEVKVTLWNADALGLMTYGLLMEQK